MVSHRAINDIMKSLKKEVHFFFSVCCVVFNCSWQLIMFDKKQKKCVKRIYLVTDDGLYGRKVFYTVKIVFYSSVTTKNFIIIWAQNWMWKWREKNNLAIGDFWWTSFSFRKCYFSNCCSIIRLYCQ